MANEITNRPKMKMSDLLACNAVKSLATNLHLSEKQIMRANASALQLTDNPTLQKCDPFSLIKYCYSTARYSFTRDDAIYPVPYGGKVQAQMGYQGYRELAMRTGKFSKIDCIEVKDCDSVTTDDDGEPVVTFEKDYLKRLEAKRIGFYAYAKNAEGKVIKSLFWTDAMAQKHGKKYSKTYGSLWGNADDFPKMAKKTLIKQLVKDLDLSEEVNMAVKEDQIVYGKEGEKDTYADNPKNITEVFDATEQQEEKRSTVRNVNIFPPKKEDTEAVEQVAEEAPQSPTPSDEAEQDAYDFVGNLIDGNN